MSCGGSSAVSTGFTDRLEDGLPAASSISPVLRLQDERTLRAVSDHEAVNHMMQLATITTALVDIAHKLPCLTAVWWVLDAERYIKKQK